MKLVSSLLVGAVSISFTGCSSLDNPLAGLNFFRSGRDARVYNAQTGQYEWPKEQAARSGQTSAGGAAGAPPRERRSDGRFFDPQKNQWVDAPHEDGSGSRPKPKPGQTATTNLNQPVEPMAAAAPPPPPPKRASGVYNPSSGRIEWDSTDAPPAPTPAPRRGWRLWPF